MAEEQDKSQKTEQPTPKRLEDSRKKGQVPISREPSTAITFLVLASLAFTGLGTNAVDGASDTMRAFLSGKETMSFDPEGIRRLAVNIAASMGEIVLPIVLPIALLGVLASFLISGPVFSVEPLKPKLERISPVSGFKRLFSTRAMVEFVKSLFKLCAIGLACWWVMMEMLPVSIAAIHGGGKHLGAVLALGTVKLAGIAAVIYIIIALGDVLYQRWEHTRSLRMDKREIREENKETEGDPLIKSRIRQIQMQQARSRMMADVAKADVVIVNPTHIAVALSYTFGSKAPPKVVAKGRGKIAERIKEIAREHGVPIRENKELARTLYGAVKVGDFIPEHLFEAVAIILAEIYRMRHGM